MLRNGSETCEAWEQSQIVFPTRSCDFLGIALAMPTCWDGRIDSPDHKSHMAYTVGGNVADPCPPGYDRRLPQVQLFVRINNYRGGTYVLSDLKDTFHVDFFNGWEEGKLQTIMNTCQPQPQGVNEYNPPCDCTPESLEDEGTYDGGLTSNEASAQICDSDIKRMIVDEDFDQISTLPVYGGSCQGEPMIERTWPTGLTADLFSTDCNNPITTTSTSSTTGSTSEFDCTSMQNSMIILSALDCVYLATTRSQTTTRASPSTTTTRETSTASSECYSSCPVRLPNASCLITSMLQLPDKLQLQPSHLREQRQRPQVSTVPSPMLMFLLLNVWMYNVSSSHNNNKLLHDRSPARGGGSPRHSVRQRRATLEMPRGCRCSGR